MFTPTPGQAALAGSKREIYERSNGNRCGHSPRSVLAQRIRGTQTRRRIIGQLKHHGKLGRATTEAREQYQNLQHLRIARLVPVGNGYAELHVIETQENNEALEMAYQLVTSGGVAGIEVDEDARRALQQEQHYVESLIASAKLKESTKAPLSEEAAHQLEIIFNK